MPTNSYVGLRKCPIISSERLWLFPLNVTHIREIVHLLSDYDTVYNLTYAPWPYTEHDARLWLNHINFLCENDAGRFWAIYDHDKNFIGTIGMSICMEHHKAELHYWLGKPFWGKGYATEAAQRILRFGFEALKLERVEVNHMTRNKQSERVIEKCHFFYEGCFRHYVSRFNVLEDVKFYSLLSHEFFKNFSKESHE